MMRFDGLYGKLVKDWGLEEWTKFYVEHYAPGVVAQGETPSDWEQRLFCGPEFTDDEARKWIDMDGHTHIEHFAEVFHLHRAGMQREGSYARLLDTKEKSHAYWAAYPYSTIYENLMVKVKRLELEAVANSLLEPIDFEFISMTESDAKSYVGQAWRYGYYKGYNGKVGAVRDAKIYAYLVERYPDIRHVEYDKAFLGKDVSPLLSEKDQRLNSLGSALRICAIADVHWLRKVTGHWVDRLQTEMANWREVSLLDSYHNPPELFREDYLLPDVPARLTKMGANGNITPICQSEIVGIADRILTETGWLKCGQQFLWDYEIPSPHSDWIETDDERLAFAKAAYAIYILDRFGGIAGLERHLGID